MYAHARIELRDPESGSVSFIERGESVPDDREILGRDELIEGGALREEDYDSAADVVPAPNEVVIDGVVYVKAEEIHQATEAADAA